MHFTNVVCSADLRCSLPLKQVCYQLLNVRYDPARFPGLIWQHKRIGGNCFIFSNGKIQCQGKASHLQEGIQRLRRYARSLQRLGYAVTLNNVRVTTATMFHTLSAPLDLKLLVQERQLIYEPELFPAANFKVENVTFSCFLNGKVIITGIKKTRDIDDVVMPTLIELELYTL